MDVQSLCPLRVGSLVWQPRAGEWTMTVVCKATFDLVPGPCRLSEHQDDVNEEDNHWNDDPARSVNQPSDLAPFKSAADVLLVGHAFSPEGLAVRSVTTRLIVHDVDKSIEVFLDRWWSQEGVLGEGARFTRMPLRYERAAGGPSSWNPVGIRQDGQADAYGKRAVPNLQVPGFLLTEPSDVIDPIGYGPISPAWPQRRAKNHTREWSVERLQQEPLPPDVERSFFNAAPPDQQVPRLRDDERIVLERLHPDHPRLVCNLPGLHPRAFVERPSGPEELTLVCDTLWIDTDRSICTAVWRGQLALESPRQPGRVLVGMEESGDRLSFSDLVRVASARDAASQNSIGEEGTALTPRPALIDEGTADAPETSRSRAPKAPPLPPHTPPAAASPTPDEPVEPGGRRRRANLSTISLGPSAMGNPSAAGGLPFLPTSAAQPEPSRPKTTTNAGLPFQPATSGPPSGGPPSSTTDRNDIAPVLTTDASPAWLKNTPAPAPTTARPPAPAAPPSAPGPMPPPHAGGSQIPPPVSAPPPPVSASGIAPAIPAPVVSPWVSSGSGADGRALGKPAPDGSAMSVSNAAAAAAVPWAAPVKAPETDLAAGPRPALRKAVSHEVVDLLWFDPEAMRRIRDKDEWRELIDEAELKKPAVGFDDEPPPEVPQAEIDRRDVFTVVTRGQFVDGEGVSEAIGLAVDHAGTFNPPLVLVSGELYFPFDELEILKATLTAVTPLVSGDKKLQEVVDTVNELLKTPWLQSSSNVAEGQTQRLKEAFSQSGRLVSPTYVEQHTDRVLLEQRAYQRRTVFGAVFIRSLFSPFGAANPIPTYIPEELAKSLPMFQRLKVRAIGEANGQQDQYESNPVSLRAVAIGRVLPISRR